MGSVGFSQNLYADKYETVKKEIKDPYKLRDIPCP